MPTTFYHEVVSQSIAKVMKNIKMLHCLKSTLSFLQLNILKLYTSVEWIVSFKFILCVLFFPIEMPDWPATVSLIASIYRIRVYLYYLTHLFANKNLFLVVASFFRFFLRSFRHKVIDLFVKRYYDLNQFKSLVC